MLLLQHEDFEYGAEVGADGQHSGGPFFIDVSPAMRVEDVRLIIQASECTVATSKAQAEANVVLCATHVQTCLKASLSCSTHARRRVLRDQLHEGSSKYVVNPISGCM